MHREIGENDNNIIIYIKEIYVQCLLSLNGHKTGIQKDNVSKKKEKKIYINPHYISHKNKNTSPIKKSYANSPSKYMTTFIPKTTSPFCHE